MRERGACEYCHEAIGEWNDWAGFACAECLAAYDERRQKAMNRYGDMYEERESQP